VDPTDPMHIAASSNDLSDTTHVYESFNRGRTWVDTNLGLGSLFCYDPWLDFNAVGDLFFAYECSDQRIGYRPVGSAIWQKAKLMNAGGFPDRDMVVVDTGAGSPFSGRVYIGYDDANANNTAYLLYSDTYVPPYIRTPKINDVSSTIGVNASVAPDGTVYAAWLDFNGKKLWVDKSTDGGATWGVDTLAHNYRINTPQFFIFIPPQPQRGIVPMPFTDVADAGPFAGRLYVTFTDKSPTTADTDTYIVFTDNGGATWSPEIKVNDDTVNAYQFHPDVTVAPNGTVAVSWYDTRNDQPNNKKTDRYVSYSTDGGVTWSVNEKWTTAMSDESGFGDANDYGDYQRCDYGPTNILQCIWTDSRPGTQMEDRVNSFGRP
jgi:hypothetical protein